MSPRTEPVPETAYFANGKVKSAGFHLEGGDANADRRVRPGRQIGAWRTYDRSGQVVKEMDFTDRR